MAEYKNEDPSARFVIPDKLTVRQQLEYYSASATARGVNVEKWWNGAKAVISEWQCELLPDMEVDLDTITDPKVTNLIIWAGFQAKNHMNGLEKVEKNS